MAARASVVPNLPAPTMPRRRSSTSRLALRDACRMRSRRRPPSSAPDAGRRAASASGACGEQLADAGDHFAAVELDHGHSLVVRDASDCVVQVEAAQAERADDRGDPVARRSRASRRTSSRGRPRPGTARRSAAASRARGPPSRTAPCSRATGSRGPRRRSRRRTRACAARPAAAAVRAARARACRARRTARSARASRR